MGKGEWWGKGGGLSSSGTQVVHTPAPGHDCGVEATVGALYTRHLHHQRQTKQLVIALAVGLVRILHITHSVEWACCTSNINIR